MAEEQTDLEQEDDLLKDDGKDLQRIKSWVGRIEAGTKDQQTKLDAIMEKLDTFSQQPAKPEFGEDDQAKFNAKLHEMILNGNVMEAMNLVNKVTTEAQSLVKRADQNKFDAALGAISDDPVMKNENLSTRVRDVATELTNKGMDAGVAVSQARTLVENETLRKMVESGQTGSLDLLSGGGGAAPAATEAQLPPAAEKQYLAGKKKGYFETRQDYIDELDPRVRKEWGL